MVRDFLRAILESVDWNVIEAPDGETALKAAVEQKPQLILLDVQLPSVSGFTIYADSRKNSATSDIPVIMVTALSEFGDIERGIDSGTDDFLSKPVNKLELLTRIKTMLKLKHLSDKLERTLAYLSEIEKQAQMAKSD